MDLSVHKAITAIALMRAATQLKTDLSPHFNGLWAGNWLTDMNQVTAFLDMVEKRVDPYAVFAMNKFREGLTGIVKKVKLGVLSLGTTVAKYFSGPGTRGLWDDLDDVIGTMSQDKVKNFEKAGRARYYEYIIETLLRDKLDQAKTICLPHHTLLAKDNDITQPECRLAYKLACVMATEVTTELFVRYFSGQNAGDPAVARDVLSAYFIHPSRHLTTGGLPDRLKKATDRLGCSRWWQYARDNTRPLVKVG